MDSSLEQQVRLDKLKTRADSFLQHSGTLRESLGERELECAEHGKYKSAGTIYFGRREVWTPCPDCEEARISRERRLEAQKKADEEAERLRYALGEAAIPARFIGRTLDNFKADTPEKERALQMARQYSDSFEEHFKRGQGLIFSGKPGTGKSHLATAILQAIMPHHIGLYITCMSLIRQVRATWRRDSEQSEGEVLQMLGDVPLLVLDEVGVQYGTDGEQTILFDILDRRYRDMQPTIILTNQDVKGLQDYIGERTFDRLREVSRLVTFDWESYRPVARKESAA